MNPSGRHFPILLALLVMGNALILGGLAAWLLWPAGEETAAHPEEENRADEVPAFMQSELPNRLPRLPRASSPGLGSGFVVPLPPDTPAGERALAPPPVWEETPSPAVTPVQGLTDWPSTNDTLGDSESTATPAEEVPASPSTATELTSPLATFPSLNPSSPSPAPAPAPTTAPPMPPPSVVADPDAITDWPSAETVENAPTPAPTPPLVAPSSIPTSSESYTGEAPMLESNEVAPQEAVLTDSGEETTIETPSVEPEVTPTPLPKPSPKARRTPAPRRATPKPTPRPSPSPRATPTPAAKEESRPGPNRRFIPFRPR